MKTSTVLILAGAGVLVVFVLTRKSSPLPTSSKSTSNNSVFGSLGQLLGGAILGAGGSLRSTSAGAVTSSSGYVAPSGDSEVAIVRSLDAGGISSYDAQGSADAPVYGIAGIDY